MLDGAQQRMLKPLYDVYPDALSADDLAIAAGYSDNNGTFRNVRGRLHTYGLVDYPNKGTVRAADILFPKGGNIGN
jgi:hypothetical protein